MPLSSTPRPKQNPSSILKASTFSFSSESCHQINLKSKISNQILKIINNQKEVLENIGQIKTEVSYNKSKFEQKVENFKKKIEFLDGESENLINDSEKLQEQYVLSFMDEVGMLEDDEISNFDLKSSGQFEPELNETEESLDSGRKDWPNDNQETIMDSGFEISNPDDVRTASLSSSDDQDQNTEHNQTCEVINKTHKKPDITSSNTTAISPIQPNIDRLELTFEILIEKDLKKLSTILLEEKTNLRRYYRRLEFLKYKSTIFSKFYSDSLNYERSKLDLAKCKHEKSLGIFKDASRILLNFDDIENCGDKDPLDEICIEDMKNTVNKQFTIDAPAIIMTTSMQQSSENKENEYSTPFKSKAPSLIKFNNKSCKYKLPTNETVSSSSNILSPPVLLKRSHGSSQYNQTGSSLFRKKLKVCDRDSRRKSFIEESTVDQFKKNTLQPEYFKVPEGREDK